MPTTQRFENAIQKLYNAFHNDALIPECAKQCAVGNILDKSDSWKYFSDAHGSTKLNYVGLVNQKFGKRFNGFTPLEILHIEKTFLKHCGYRVPLDHRNERPKDPLNKDRLFEGLCGVITYLCKLEGIPNITDYSKLFETSKTVIKEEISI